MSRHEQLGWAAGGTHGALRDDFFDGRRDAARRMLPAMKKSRFGDATKKQAGRGTQRRQLRGGPQSPGRTWSLDTVYV